MVKGKKLFQLIKENCECVDNAVFTVHAAKGVLREMTNSTELEIPEIQKN